MSVERGSAPPRGGGGETLPRQLTWFRSPIIWGVLLLVVIEGTVLSLFVVSFFYLRLVAEDWPPPGIEPPELLLPTLAQVLILLSALPLLLALRPLGQDRVRPLLLALPAGMAFALGYLVITVVEYAGKDYSWDTHAYGSLDWSMSGYACLHVIVVVLAASFVWILARRGHFGASRLTGVQALLIYWIYAALAAVAFFGVQYLAPHFVGGGGFFGAPG